MGGSEYIIPYKSNKEKTRINECIQKYKDKYIEYEEHGAPYNKFMNLICEIDETIQCDQYNLEKKRICDKHPEIDFTGIDIYEEDITDEYQKYDTLIAEHQRITIRNPDELEKAIRVYFNTGYSSDFSRFLDSNKIKHDVNYTVDYQVEEEY